MLKWKETLMFIDLWTSGWKCSEDEVSKGNLMKLKTRKVNPYFFLGLIWDLFVPLFSRKVCTPFCQERGYVVREQCLSPWIPWQHLSLCQAGSLHLAPSDGYLMVEHPDANASNSTLYEVKEAITRWSAWGVVCVHFVEDFSCCSLSPLE